MLSQHPQPSTPAGIEPVADTHPAYDQITPRATPDLGAIPDSSPQPLPSSQSGTQFVLIVQDRLKTYSITLKDVIETMGRSQDNSIRLCDRYVSRYHAYLVRVPDPTTDGYTYCIFDGHRKLHTPSRNGLFVNKSRVKSHLLQVGDVINLGPLVQAYFYTVPYTLTASSGIRDVKRS